MMFSMSIAQLQTTCWGRQPPLLAPFTGISGACSPSLPMINLAEIQFSVTEKPGQRRYPGHHVSNAHSYAYRAA
jgi:hypothetical protein